MQTTVTALTGRQPVRFKPRQSPSRGRNTFHSPADFYGCEPVAVKRRDKIERKTVKQLTIKFAETP